MEGARSRRDPRLVACGMLAAAALTLGGCYLSAKAPSLDGAPAAVRDRAELPSCGRAVEGYIGVSSDAGAAECFWDHYQRGEPAEYQSFFYSDAGESIWIYRIEAADRIVVYGSGGPDDWVRSVCSGLTSTADDPAMGGPGFVPDDCAPPEQLGTT